MPKISVYIEALCLQLFQFTEQQHSKQARQSNLGIVRRYNAIYTPHVGECTLPLRVLAVQCATLRNGYRTFRKRYRSVTGHYGTLRNFTEPWRKISILPTS